MRNVGILGRWIVVVERRLILRGRALVRRMGGVLVQLSYGAATDADTQNDGHQQGVY